MSLLTYLGASWRADRTSHLFYLTWNSVWKCWALLENTVRRSNKLQMPGQKLTGWDVQQSAYSPGAKPERFFGKVDYPKVHIYILNSFRKPKIHTQKRLEKALNFYLKLNPSSSGRLTKCWWSTPEQSQSAKTEKGVSVFCMCIFSFFFFFGLFT